MPMERPRLQSRDTTAPWRKVSLTSEFVNILLQILVDRITHQGENQSQTPEPIWITLLLQVQNLDEIFDTKFKRCYLTRAVVSPAAQSVVAAVWFGMSKAAQAIREGVTDLEDLNSKHV